MGDWGKLITVIPDPVVEVEKEVGMPSGAAEVSAFLDKVQGLALDYAKFSWRYSVFGLGEKVVRSVIEARERALTKGLDVQWVSMIEATQNLVFPIDHPRPEVVYMRHPANPLWYLPVAEFHRLVFADKVNEAIRLLSALGANEISIQHMKGWSRMVGGEWSVSLPSEAGGEKIGGSLGAEARTGENFVFRASLDGNDTPALHKDPIWYPHESTWQMLAKLRMEHGLKDFSLKLTYEDDHQVNANLTTAIEGAGLQLGGKFENHQSTEWVMSGHFGARHKD